MPRAIPYKNGYRVNFTHGGKRYRKTFRTKREADQFIRVQTAGAEQASEGASLPGQIREFLRWSEKDKKKSASWCKTQAQMLQEFAKFCDDQEVETVGEITHELVGKYRTWFAAHTKRSDATWDKYRQSISAFLNWCAKRDPGVVNVAADDEFKVKTQLNSPDTFDYDEIRQILKYFDTGESKEMATAIRVLLYAGVRLGELVSLTWDQIDLNAAGGQGVLKVGTKTKKQRTVPIAQELKPWIEKMYNSNHTFFLDDGHGHQLHHRKAYYNALQRACATMGIRRRPLHALRHTFVRFLLENNPGLDLPTVAKICGHEDIRTTMRYAQHYSIDRAQNALDSLTF